MGIWKSEIGDFFVRSQMKSEDDEVKREEKNNFCFMSLDF
jgi:hypothetical protein